MSKRDAVSQRNLRRLRERAEQPTHVGAPRRAGASGPLGNTLSVLRAVPDPLDMNYMVGQLVDLVCPIEVGQIVLVYNEDPTPPMWRTRDLFEDHDWRDPMPNEFASPYCHGVIVNLEHDVSLAEGLAVRVQIAGFCPYVVAPLGDNVHHNGLAGKINEYGGYETVRQPTSSIWVRSYCRPAGERPYMTAWLTPRHVTGGWGQINYPWNFHAALGRMFAFGEYGEEGGPAHALTSAHVYPLVMDCWYTSETRTLKFVRAHVWQSPQGEFRFLEWLPLGSVTFAEGAVTGHTGLDPIEEPEAPGEEPASGPGDTPGTYKPYGGDPGKGGSDPDPPYDPPAGLPENFPGENKLGVDQRHYWSVPEGEGWVWVVKHLDLWYCVDDGEQYICKQGYFLDPGDLFVSGPHWDEAECLKVCETPPAPIYCYINPLNHSQVGCYEEGAQPEGWVILSGPYETMEDCEAACEGLLPCPQPVVCKECGDTLTASFTFACGEYPCPGPYVWNRITVPPPNGQCAWTCDSPPPCTTGNGPTFPTVLTVGCITIPPHSLAAWQWAVMHPTGAWCYYRMWNVDNCPQGTYFLRATTCEDCPELVVLT